MTKDLLTLYYDDNENGGSSRWLVAPDIVEMHVKRLIKNAKEEQMKLVIAEIERKIKTRLIPKGDDHNGWLKSHSEANIDAFKRLKKKFRTWSAT